MNNLVLNLWDCGGQDAFYENYFESQREHIFRNVEVLIYVFDVESNEVEKDLQRYEACLAAIRENSEGAKVFVLVHKMDLVPEDQRPKVFADKQELLRARSGAMQPTCFATSIWDETLYKAWSSIVYSLVPNIDLLESHLDEFGRICDADEVVLFERATFLVISHVATQHRQHRDAHRFEKMSNIIKQFKLSCSKTQAQFQAMVVKNAKFTAFIDYFTTNTYVMVIMSDDSIYPAAIEFNIAKARKHFETFIKKSVAAGGGSVI